MSNHIPDKELSQLAKLVGEALAKRWMQILSKRRAAKTRSCRQQATGDKKPKNSVTLYPPAAVRPPFTQHQSRYQPGTLIRGSRVVGDPFSAIARRFKHRSCVMQRI
jgi:hypothetical protein